MSTATTIAAIVAGVPAALYAYKCAMMVAFQNKLIYLGYIPLGARHEQFVPDKTTSHLDIKEQTIVTKDNERLHGFIVQHPERGRVDEAGGPILIYYQGNAGNMIHRFNLFDTMLKAVPSMTIVGICYRGFGSSTGRASEKGLQTDALAIYKHVCTTFDASRPIILYGHSLGGSVAIHLAADPSVGKQRLQGVIVENTYTSIEDMVQAMYPRYTPYPFIAKRFLWNHWRSIDKIGRIKALFAAARSSASPTWVTFPRSMHMDMYTVEPVIYKEALRQFISTIKVNDEQRAA